MSRLVFHVDAYKTVAQAMEAAAAERKRKEAEAAAERLRKEAEAEAERLRLEKEKAEKLRMEMEVRPKKSVSNVYNHQLCYE
jgi:cell division protein FtsL